MASYNAQLAQADPNRFGLAVCTVDGQQFQLGDSGALFTLQSMHKPLNYALAVDRLGVQQVHRFVGTEPHSERMAFSLLENPNHPGSFRPHNPFINAGAIVVSYLVTARSMFLLGDHGVAAF